VTQWRPVDIAQAQQRVQEGLGVKICTCARTDPRFAVTRNQHHWRGQLILQMLNETRRSRLGQITSLNKNYRRALFAQALN